MDNIDTVIDALERAPALVVPLVREMPIPLLKRRPTPEKWSVHEHACHLATVHGVFFQRLDYLLSHPAPVITPYLPGTDEPDDALMRMDLDDALASYSNDRARLVERLRQVSPTEWAKSAIHPEYSRYTVFIMFRHLALHDLFHAYRIEELVLNPAWGRGA